jgi:hypothetical protein
MIEIVIIHTLFMTTMRNGVSWKIAHMHLHTWKQNWRVQSFGKRLFCLTALEFYRLFDLKLILCEPRAINPTPNNMLTKAGFKKGKLT